MMIKQLLDEDFVNYKEPSMFISFPHCTFKCEKENGNKICQNSILANSSNIEINNNKIIQRYLNNPITKSIVIGGLEPFDDFEQLYNFILEFRTICLDDIVIYTGYCKTEISSKIDKLSYFKNIIVKFGRYVPNQNKHYDEILGIYLASYNQYAERISKCE